MAKKSGWIRAAAAGGTKADTAGAPQKPKGERHLSNEGMLLHDKATAERLYRSKKVGRG